MNWFFKAIISGNSTYLYDARTNFILKLNRDVPQGELLEGVDRKYAAEFGEEFLKGYTGIEQVRFQLSKEEIIDRIEHGMKELSLNVTEDCNFRCGYCIYSGKYHYERTHSQRTMSNDVAERAVDFFFGHNEQNNPVYIGFYGGEPLLAYGLVRHVVSYVKKGYPSKDVIFSITTNGSLLTPDKFDFITSNDFSMLVSLDGPKKIHDKNRRYRNHSETHDVVMSNLKNLQMHSPDYYRRSVGFLATVSDPLELEDVNEFFKSNELVRGHRVITSFVKPYDAQFPIIKHTEEEMNKMWLNLADEHCESIIQRRNYNPFLQRLFDLDLKAIHEREAGIVPSQLPLKGPCVPGNRKLFVSTSGDIQLCERVGTAFKIGNINTGINHDKVLQLIHDYVELNQDDCPTCWATRVCRPCYAYFRKGDDLDSDRKVEACDSLKETLSLGLYIYVKVHEQDSSALKEYFEQHQTLLP